VVITQPREVHVNFQAIQSLVRQKGNDVMIQVGQHKLKVPNLFNQWHFVPIL
jgi:hypothetical protein